MTGSFFFRFIAALAPSVASALVVGSPDEAPNFNQVIALRVEEPVNTGFSLFGSSNSVVVPLVMEVKDGDAVTETSINLPLEPKLVESMQEGFGREAIDALRSLEKAVLKGLEARDENVRAASADVLPLIQEAVPFRVLGDVPISEHVEQKVVDIATKVYSRSGARVVVTSAVRSPERQADAMRVKLELGESPRRLYADKHAAGEIELAYKWAKKTGLDDGQVTDTMAMVIQRQVDQGIYISRHLRAGAVDLRCRDLTSEQKHAVIQAAQEEGARIMLESTPPHFHLDVF